MTPVTFYSKIEAKRTEWEPIKPTKTEQVQDEAADILSRALALRALELPVRDFILDGLGQKEKAILGQEGVECLMRNTKDEERHDQALENVVSVLSNYNPKYEAEAAMLTKAWVTHPDHSIAKAAVLENGIFFMILPLMRRFGSVSLINSSVDISSDEINHVQSHRYATTQLGHKISPSLDKLRKATAAWIVGTFNFSDTVNATTLMKASDNLMYKGVAPELSFSQSFNVPAFFESSNSSLSYYTK